MGRHPHRPAPQSARQAVSPYSPFFSLLFFHASQSLSSTVTWGRGHDRVAWKMLALAAEVQPPLLHAIPGKAVSRNMGFLAAGAAAFQVRGTGAAVKTASAE